MAEKQKNPTTKEQNNYLIELIEGVKDDNLKQFGEIKKEFGGFEKIQGDQDKRIKALEKDKIKRDAIEEYKRDNPKEAQAVMNKDQNTVTIPKDLLTAAKYIAWGIAALIAALLGLKMI